jgi:hypothetical protein
MKMGRANKEGAGARTFSIFWWWHKNFPVRGTRPLSEIYERNNVAVLEPAEFKEAEKDNKWFEAMKEEIEMIEEKKLHLAVGGHNSNLKIGR